MFSSPFNKWGRETQRLCELAKVTQLGGTTATHCVVLTSGQTHGCKSPLQPLILLGVVPHFSAQNAVETQHRPVTCPLCHTVPFLNRVKSVLRNEVITPSICPTPSFPHPSAVTYWPPFCVCNIPRTLWSQGLGTFFLCPENFFLISILPFLHFLWISVYQFSLEVFYHDIK